MWIPFFSSKNYFFLEKSSKEVFKGKYNKQGTIVDSEGNPFNVCIESIIKGKILTEFFREFLRQYTNPHNNLKYYLSCFFAEDYLSLFYYHTGEKFKYYIVRNYKDFEIDVDKNINILNFWDEEVKIEKYLDYLQEEFSENQDIRKLFGFKHREKFPNVTVMENDESYDKLLIKIRKQVEHSLQYENCLDMAKINGLIVDVIL